VTGGAHVADELPGRDRRIEPHPVGIEMAVVGVEVTTVGDDDAVAGTAGKTTTPGAADHGPGGGRVDGGADGGGDVLARVGAAPTRSAVVSPVAEVSKGRVAPGAVHRRCRIRGGATGKTGHGDGCSDARTEERAARPRGGGFLS